MNKRNFNTVFRKVPFLCFLYISLNAAEINLNLSQNLTVITNSENAEQSVAACKTVLAMLPNGETAWLGYQKSIKNAAAPEH